MAKVTAFYSYKGGSGRSMAVANVAWALATNGERVLAIDWDLEAPGLHRYFHPFLADPEQSASPGLVDRIWDFIDSLSVDVASNTDIRDRFSLADCSSLVQALELPPGAKGALHLFGAGRQDEQYSQKVGGLDWSTFYMRFDGEAFIDRLMVWARANYTHILIDSRTGVADTAGICTTQIPDALMMCLVYNRQSIEGTAAIARSVIRARRARKQAELAISLIPCRVEERGMVDSARRHAAIRLAEALEQDRVAVEHELRRSEIRHHAWCAFEEKLAVFEDVPEERGSMLDSMHGLARRVANRSLGIKRFPPQHLATLWRRAAFGDPRLIDLETLSVSSADEASSQLVHWIDLAAHEPNERPEWLMALAEAAMDRASAPDDRISPPVVEFLARSALALGERGFELTPDQGRARFAGLLHAYANHLQRRFDYRGALGFAQRAADLLAQERAPESRWRYARALERIAELLESLGDKKFLEFYRAAADAYLGLAQRELPLGAEFDAPRALRLLAEKALAAGDMLEADRVSDHAVRLLPRLASGHRGRDSLEIANVLAARAEVVAALDTPHLARELLKIRRLASDLLETSLARAELDRRVALAQARRAARLGLIDQALAILDGMPQDSARSADAVWLHADILLRSGQAERAADLLVGAIQDPHLMVTPALLDHLTRALTATGRQQDLAALLQSRLPAAERQDDVAMSLLINRLNSSALSPSDWNLNARGPPMGRAPGRKEK